MRSGRRTTPTPVSTQSPQFRMPSDAVHGRSNAKRKTLTIATRSAAAHTGHGCPKTSRYCGLNRRAIARDSTGRAAYASRIPTAVELSRAGDPHCRETREGVGLGGGTPVPPPNSMSERWAHAHYLATLLLISAFNSRLDDV